MQNYKVIESKDNALIKRAVSLAKDSKFRGVEQQAIIYGEHLLIEALHHKLLAQVFVLIDSWDKYDGLLGSSNVEIILINSDIMNKLNLLDSTIDVVAVINQPPAAMFNNDSDCLILENIQDPGNLGTILRAANAGGIKQVVISQNSVDIYNPKVLRSSQGIQFGLNIYTQADIVKLLQNYNGQILAFTPNSTETFYQYDLSIPSAFVFGNEGNGLSANLLQVINKHVQIPMLGNTESINLAMAVTVAVFEMSRQRLNKVK